MSGFIDDSDLRRLEQTMKQMGKVPQKCVTKAARKGGNALIRAVRRNAPVDTGALKKGLKLKGEKHRKKGKKAYQVTFSADDNDVFQKKNADGEITGYYPVSQEYGFFAKNGRYIPGYRYMRNAAEDNEAEINGVMLDTLDKELEREWNKN